jgi:hypothetical protein
MILWLIKIEVKIEKVECINERVNLLTELPSVLNLTLMPPPRATFSKTKPNRIKEPIFAIESSIATNTIGSSVSIN